MSGAGTRESLKLLKQVVRFCALLPFFLLPVSPQLHILQGLLFATGEKEQTDGGGCSRGKSLF